MDRMLIVRLSTIILCAVACLDIPEIHSLDALKKVRFLLLLSILRQSYISIRMKFIFLFLFRARFLYNYIFGVHNFRMLK